MIPRKKKGQIVVYDFIFGFMAFIIVFTLAVVIWYQTTNRVMLEDIQAEKFKTARDLAGRLVYTPGYPPFWELDGCDGEAINCTIGLATSPLVLSEEKVEALVQFFDTPIQSELEENYMILKDLLHVGIFDYYITIRDGTTVVADAGFPSAGNLTVTVSRRVIFRDRIHTLEVTVH